MKCFIIKIRLFTESTWSCGFVVNYVQEIKWQTWMPDISMWPVHLFELYKLHVSKFSIFHSFKTAFWYVMFPIRAVVLNPTSKCAQKSSTAAQQLELVLRAREIRTHCSPPAVPVTCCSSNSCTLGRRENRRLPINVNVSASECLSMSVHLWTGNLSSVFSCLLYYLRWDELQHLVTPNRIKWIRQRMRAETSINNLCLCQNFPPKLFIQCLLIQPSNRQLARARGKYGIWLLCLCLHLSLLLFLILISLL